METRVQRPRTVHIDVWSDVVCPWCWIGKRRLERAFELRTDLVPCIRWRAYFLNPRMPREGMDRQEYLDHKFGGADGIRSVYAPIEAVGAEEGLPFRFGSIRRMPSTRDAHRLVCWAGTSGEQNQLSETLFDAFFSRGADIGSRNVLLEAALESGLDGDAAGAILDSDRFGREVEQDNRLARQMGIAGVPCFVFAESVAIPGAVAPNVFLTVLAHLCGARESLPA